MYLLRAEFIASPIFESCRGSRNSSSAPAGISPCRVPFPATLPRDNAFADSSYLISPTAPFDRAFNFAPFNPLFVSEFASRSAGCGAAAGSRQLPARSLALTRLARGSRVIFDAPDRAPSLASLNFTSFPVALSPRILSLTAAPALPRGSIRDVSSASFSPSGRIADLSVSSAGLNTSADNSI